MVTLLSVKPKAFMNANVAMMDAGMATDAINVDRHERINNITVRQARIEPETRWFSISCKADRMYRDWS